MTRNAIAWCLLATALSACGASQPLRTTSSLALRAEVGGGPSLSRFGPVAIGAATAAFSTGALCCSFGPYVLGLMHGDDHAEFTRTETVLSAGLEVSTYVTPRIGFMLRGGAAGTAPRAPSLGRRGFAGSGSIFYRLSDPNPPAVGAFAPLVEIGVGMNMFALNADRSSAGSDALGVSSDPTSGFDLLFTLRLGANYGLDPK